MHRRSLLATIATTGIAGCAKSSLDTGRELDLPEENVYSIGEEVEYDVVLIQTAKLEAFSKVKYTDSVSAEIKTWDPGKDKNVVITSYWVENLSNRELDWPHWSDFKLAHPEGVSDPIQWIPGGESVEEIRNERVSWPGSTGLRADYERGWSGVYVTPSVSLENYATKWTRPDKPFYWARD